jgi:ankyrin repeat protein
MIFKAVTTHQVAHDPALHHASLELLLQAGAKVNTTFKDAQGHECTLLMLACYAKCCTAPVRMLLAHGADPALQTSAGMAALHSAATAGHADVCKMLLEAGCELDVRDNNGITPLAKAVNKGHVHLVELLHKQWGADLSIKSITGDTLLHAAANHGHSASIEYLVHHGLDINAVTVHAVTAIQIAVQKGNTAAVQTLLDHGASTTAGLHDGENALMVAVKEGHADVVKLLLRYRNSNKQPVVAVNAKNVEGRTALHMAACTDRVNVAALLLQHGAAVNARNDRGLTPLALAAARSSAELVQLLLDAGADVTANTSVLHHAVSNKERSEVLQLLLEQNGVAAEIDNLAISCGCCGPRTAIMMCEQPAHLKLLLAAGADVHMVTIRGNTALHVAAIHKFAAPVLCLLIKAGVDLHAVNSAGKTAAEVAAESDNTLAAALLARAARDT